MKSLPDVRALSFDADQTLWDFGGVYRKALDATVAAIIDRGHATAEQATPQVLKGIRDELILDYRGEPHNLEEVREQSFVVFLETVGHANPKAAARELVEIYMHVRFGAIELYPEVSSALLRLGQRFKLGLLTNGNTYPERCGLPGVFDAQVLGPEHGFEKPDPRAFEKLAAELDVSCSQLLHVGDDWDDIEGANRVGAISVFMNRTAAQPDFAQIADHEIVDLIELETLVAPR